MAEASEALELPMHQLWNPWRLEYVKGRGKASDSCIFCLDQPASAASAQIIARSSHTFALLNRYPYTYAHTMIVPFEHVSTPEELAADALTDMMLMSNRLMRVLRKLAEPAGFNLGANIGAAAGAGIAAHYHFHVVPRWSGDANFMVTIGETQTIPDTLANIAREMRATWEALYGPPRA